MRGLIQALSGAAASATEGHDQPASYKARFVVKVIMPTETWDGAVILPGQDPIDFDSEEVDIVFDLDGKRVKISAIVT